MDAASVEFVEHFLEEGRRPEWFVTSPSYRKAFAFFTNACRIATVGATFELRLNFLEPVASRAQWLMQNPPCTEAGSLRGLKPGLCGKFTQKRRLELSFVSPRRNK